MTGDSLIIIFPRRKILTIHKYDIKQLTVAKPSMTRTTYTSITLVLANSGVKSVHIQANAMANPNTRLPPNLSDKYPPGIWVTI